MASGSRTIRRLLDGIGVRIPAVHFTHQIGSEALESRPQEHLSLVRIWVPHANTSERQLFDHSATAEQQIGPLPSGHALPSGDKATFDGPGRVGRLSPVTGRRLFGFAQIVAGRECPHVKFIV